MNESETADKILQDVKTLMDSSSNVEKFQLRQKLVDEWAWLTCSQRLWVGKELEKKTQNLDADKVKATFGYDEETNTLDSLEFDRYVPPYEDATGGIVGEKRNHIVIKDPFKECNFNSNDRSR